MTSPDFPDNEAERLLALKRTALLDSQPEERFDRITRLAASVFGVDICLFSLIDSDRQWFKSKVGINDCQMGRSTSFCGHAILENDVFVIQNAINDERFSDNPLVLQKPNIRFYAGASLREPSGQPIGTLCLIDSKARDFSLREQQQLREFADLVENEIAKMDLEYFEQCLSKSTVRIASIIEALPDIVFVIDRSLRFTLCNEHPDLLKPKGEIQGQRLFDVLPSELAGQMLSYIEGAFDNNNLLYHNYTLEQLNQSFEARYQKITENEVLVVIRNITEQVSAQSEVRRLSEIAKQTTNGVVVTNENGEVVWINNAFSDISGYSIEDMLGKKPGDVLQGPDTDAITIDKMRAALASQESFNVEIVNYSKVGKAYWIRISCNPFSDENGHFCGYIAIENDITKEKHNEEIIRENENLLDAVIDANAIGVWRLNLLDGQLIVNEKWATLLGYELSELTPISRDTWERLTHPDDLVYAAQQINEYAAGLTPHYDVNIRMKHKSGQWKWINTRGKVASNAKSGEVEWLLGTHFNIDEQLQAESQLKEASSKMSAVVENLLDGVITINSRGNILTANEAAQAIFGYSHRELIGNNISMLMGSPHREHHNKYLANYLDHGGSDITGRIRELDAQHKDGTTFPIELGVVEISLEDDTNFIGIVRDITARRQRENKIHQLAFYDTLTSLPNRRLMLERLYEARSHCNRTGSHAALLILDLDNFKNFNDSAGHAKGDQLLCQVAMRLSETVTQGDTVSRLSGDEFVILATGLSDIEHIAAGQCDTLASELLAKIEHQFDIEGVTYQCSASIGITVCSRNSVSVDDLLKQADMAMYKAKASGRNRVCFFDPKMQDDVNVKAEIIQELYAAISEEQFELFYQKQVDEQGRSTGVEVLLRWFHPAKGMISPAQFIPIAEDTGLIVPIGQWVLTQACQTLARWASEPTTEALTIAVNISVIQFNKDNFVQTVINTLHATGANPHRLKLELTENMLISDIVDIKEKMFTLQRYGVMFSIDDFGTGYSSLFYLKLLPLNQLKIDQAFVRDIMLDSNDKAIAQSIITLAGSLGLEVIAEGVETEAQRALLQSMGCRAYQGYLFGKPCSIDDLYVQ